MAQYLFGTAAHSDTGINALGNVRSRSRPLVTELAARCPTSPPRHGIPPCSSDSSSFSFPFFALCSTRVSTEVRLPQRTEGQRELMTQCCKCVFSIKVILNASKAMVPLLYVYPDRCFANGNARLCRCHRVLDPFEQDSARSSRLVVAWHWTAAGVLRTCGGLCDPGLLARAWKRCAVLHSSPLEAATRRGLSHLGSRLALQQASGTTVYTVAALRVAGKP